MEFLIVKNEDIYYLYKLIKENDNNYTGLNIKKTKYK